MADKIVPHFHNDPGVAAIEIGAREFMCIGATPPFDHPHVFIDMGDDSEAICPYCSTLYRYDPSLHGYQSRPPECAWREPASSEPPQLLRGILHSRLGFGTTMPGPRLQYLMLPHDARRNPRWRAHGP